MPRNVVDISTIAKRLSTYFLRKRGNNVVDGNISPEQDMVNELGKPDKRWLTVYAKTVSAENIAGQMTGTEWVIDGPSATIDVKQDNATTTLLVRNRGTNGTVNLDVENDIIVGGLVDGVDIAATKTDYDNHKANPDAHHAAFVGLEDDAGAAVTPNANDRIRLTGGGIITTTASGNSILISADTSGQVPASRQIIAGDGLIGGGPLSADVTLHVNPGDGIQIASDAVTVDATVVRTSRTITAGSGLIGGGDLSANRTINVGAGDGISVSADSVSVDGTVARNTWPIIAGSGLTGGGNLSPTGVTLNVNPGDGIQIVSDAVAVDSTVVRTTRQLIAGNGLTGGGDLSADRTFNVGAGTGITVGADTVGVNTAYSFNWTGTHNWGGTYGVYIYPTANVASGPDIELPGDGLIAAGENLHINIDSDNSSTASKFSIRANGRTSSATEVFWVEETGKGYFGNELKVDTGLIGSYDEDLQLRRAGTTKLTLGSTQATFVDHVNMPSLDVSGAATVWEDLTVGPAYASPGVLFVDASGQSVGINRAPDLQFALDVSGPARADWFVGPHAIQLSDAEMIVHFDGPRPYNTDFTGFSIGHKGQVATESGGVIYRPGKFGKAVQVAEGTTNLVTNPSFEADVVGSSPAGWAVWNGSGGNLSATVTDEDAVYGTQCARLTATTVNNSQFYHQISGTYSSGDVITASIWMRADAPTTASWQIRRHSSPYTGYAAVSCNITTEWQRFTVTATVTDDGVPVRVDLFPGVGTIYVDAVQAEAKPYATPYCLSPETMVSTSRGIIKLDDVIVGDKLLGNDGFNEVRAKWYVETDAYQIELTNGYKITASADHRFMATKWPWDYNKTSGWSFRSVSNLGIGDYIKLSTVENVEDGANEPEMAYLIGYLIGDGYFCSSDSRGKPRIGWTFGANYRYLADHLKNLYESCMPKSPNGGVNEYPSVSACSEKEWVIVTQNQRVARVLLERGVVPDSGSHGKSIPKCVWSYKKGDLIAFLTGLVDSDGSVDTDGSIKIDSSSRKLIDEIRLLVSMRLGVHGHISSFIDGNNFTGRERVMYRIRFTKADSAYLFSIGLIPVHRKKRERLEFSSESKFRRREWAKIKSITYVGKQRLIDITLEPNHDFVAEGIVTHNCDGSLGQGHSWSGTAHASSSTRSAAGLRWSWPFRHDKPWTIGFWVKNSKGYASASAEQYILSVRANADTDSVSIYDTTASGSITVRWRANSVTSWWGYTFPSGTDLYDWHHIALAYDLPAGEVRLYVDGVHAWTKPASAWSDTSANPYVMIGIPPWTTIANNAYPPFPGYIDDLFVLSRAASADEIRAIYESNAPVFAESSVFAFRAPSRTPVWVDEEGMWARSLSGNSAFGLYAGDASKSWGGLTLYDSDLVIGNSSAGYLAWWSGVDASSPHYNDPMLQIAGSTGVSLEFSAGTGRLKVGNNFLIDANGLQTGDLGATPTNGHLLLDTSGNLKGYSASAGQSVLWLDLNPDDGIVVKNGADEVFVAEKTGNLFAGSGWSGRPIDTDVKLRGVSLAVFATDTTFGASTLGAGDVVIGDYTAAHMLWDASAGQLKFVDGSAGVTELYIGTDGKLVAGSGKASLGRHGIYAFDSSNNRSFAVVGDDYIAPIYDTWYPGDVIIGDIESSTGANVKWDSIGKRLLVREGATTNVYLDQDGLSIIAGLTDDPASSVTWRDGVNGAVPAYISGMYTTPANAHLGIFVSPAASDNSELSLRSGGQVYAKIELMANRGVIGSLGDGNVYGALLRIEDDATNGELITVDADFLDSYAPLRLREQNSTPSAPANANAEAHIYIKSDKLVIQYKDGGTVRYKYLPLSGTSVTWVHTTTAP